MLLKFTVKAANGVSVKQIEALQKKLSSAKGVNTAVGKAFEKTLRTNFRSLDRRLNKRGWKKSHFWQKIASDTVFTGADESKGVVAISNSSGSKFATKVFGAGIRPKSGKKFWAIPAIEARYGVSLSSLYKKRTSIPPDAPRRVARRHTRGRHNAGALLARPQGRHATRSRRASEERSRIGRREKINFFIP